MSTSIFDYQRSIVSILNSDQQIVGTGFAVTDHFILTCAHVVIAAGGGPGSNINVRFYDTSEICNVLVASEYWKAEKDEDVAFLFLKQGLPSSINPARLSKSINSYSHPFRAFGYPIRKKAEFEGGWAIGAIAGPFEYNGRTILQIESSNLTHGMSGSPIFDDILEGVVGMVSEVYFSSSNSKNRDSAFAIPSDMIIGKFEKILLEDSPTPKPQVKSERSISSLRPKSKKTLNGTDYIIQSLITQKSFGNMVIRTAKAGDKVMQESVGIYQLEFIENLPGIQKDMHRNYRRFQNFNNAANNSSHLAGIRQIIPPSDKNLWVIYRWVNGPSLADCFPLSGPFPTKPLLKQLLTYCVDICSGLAEIHRFSEMHLGVHENTIVIHQKLGAILIDSSFAKSPIPIRSDQEPFNPRVDIYALGATLYRIMTHRMPQMQPASKINPAIPQLLDQLLSEILFGSISNVLDIKREFLSARGQIS